MVLFNNAQAILKFLKIEKSNPTPASRAKSRVARKTAHFRRCYKRVYNYQLEYPLFTFTFSACARPSVMT